MNPVLHRVHVLPPPEQVWQFALHPDNPFIKKLRMKRFHNRLWNFLLGWMNMILTSFVQKSTKETVKMGKRISDDRQCFVDLKTEWDYETFWEIFFTLFLFWWILVGIMTIYDYDFLASIKNIFLEWERMKSQEFPWRRSADLLDIFVNEMKLGFLLVMGTNTLDYLLP